MRLFVGIDAPPAWREAAATIQRELTAQLPRELTRAIRPFDPALMHLTLRFLGEVDEAALRDLQAALDEHAPPVDLELALGAAGTFGAPARTSVAWLGIEGDLNGLRALTRRVHEGTGAIVPVERRTSFSPHLTLARVRRETSPEERRAIAEAVRALTPPDRDSTAIRARELVLIRSHLGASQPRYEVLSRHG
jgi:RNA 2',3'-cyclic 3'-phosphodiesterase